MDQDQTLIRPRAGVLETGVPPNLGEAAPLLPEQVLGAIYSLSRGAGSIVAIGSRRPGADGGKPYPHYLTALSVANWQPYLPALIEYGTLRSETLYWCPNPLRPAAIKSRQTPEELTDRVLSGGGPQYLEVKNKHVAELGALVLDLDVGRPGSRLTAAEAIGLSVIRALDGRLTPPSLFAYSGTGAYLFYLLTAQDGLLPLATTEAVAVYKGCQQVLLRLTADLESDRNATRLAQWLKMPGTVDTKTGHQVVYLPFLSAGDRDLRRYDLGTLASRLGIEPPEDRRHDLPPGRVELLIAPPIVATATPAPAGEPGAPRVRVRRVKLGKGGEMWRLRYRELEALWQHRGGIIESAPSRHLFLRIVWLTCLRDALTNAPRELDRAARRRLAYEETMTRLNWVNTMHCRPPLPDADLAKLTNPGRYTSRRVIQVLGITEAERRDLEFTHLVTAAERQERRRRDQEAVQTRRQDQKALRAAMDADLAQGLGVKATARRYGVNPGTASRRLAKLRSLGQARTPSLFDRPDAPEAGGGVA